MSDKEEKTFKPYIPPERTKPELTAASVIIGMLLSIIFGAANAYLGLRVGKHGVLPYPEGTACAKVLLSAGWWKASCPVTCPGR